MSKALPFGQNMVVVLAAYAGGNGETGNLVVDGDGIDGVMKSDDEDVDNVVGGFARGPLNDSECLTRSKTYQRSQPGWKMGVVFVPTSTL